MKNKSQIIGIVFGLSLLLALISIVWKHNDNETPSASAEFDSSNILELSWAEAEELIDGNCVSFLYVGRDNCPACVEFKPKLNELAAEADITIFYYNTIEDRENIPEEFQERMEYLGVESVPAVLIVGNGGFEKLDSEDNLLREVWENLPKVE